MRHKFLVLTVKKWLKSVYIYGRYREIKTGVSLFWTTLYRRLISYITPLSDGTPANIRMYFIFLENKSPGLYILQPTI